MVSRTLHPFNRCRCACCLSAERAKRRALSTPSMRVKKTHSPFFSRALLWRSCQYDLTFILLISARCRHERETQTTHSTYLSCAHRTKPLPRTVGGPWLGPP